MRIGAVDEHHAVLPCAKEVVELALCATYAFERSKALQMRLAHVGDEAAGGLSSLHQPAYVTRMRCSHLYHCDVVGVVNPEQSLRHADVVVEVTLRCEHAHLLSEHTAYQLLGGGFAVGARYTHDRYIELPAVVACQMLQGSGHIVDEYVPVVTLGHCCGVVDNGISATLLKC